MPAKKFCPKCRSTDLIMVAGGSIGMWECKKCRFRGSIFPEKDALSSRSRGPSRSRGKGMSVEEEKR